MDTGREEVREHALMEDDGQVVSKSLDIGAKAGM